MTALIQTPLTLSSLALVAVSYSISNEGNDGTTIYHPNAIPKPVTEQPFATQQPNYLSEEVQIGGTKFPFLLLTPKSIQKETKYPLVLFLHGAGERGKDNEKQKRHFPELMARQEYQDIHPTFVLAPQCPENQSWVDIDWSSKKSTPHQPNPTMPMQSVIAALAKVVREHPIDLERISLTGLSMGGYGTWDLAMRHPYFFASVIPICGGGDEENVARLSGLPVQVWHGEDDRVVPVIRSQKMVEEIKKLGMAVDYFELPNTKHNSWHEAYRRKEFLNLIFSAKRNLAEMQDSSAQILSRNMEEKEVVAFFGDSITQFGNKNGGYVDLIRRAIRKEGPDSEIIPAGISGNKVPDLLKRLDRDIIGQKPTVVFVYIGINDVWHSEMGSGTPIEQYSEGLREIIQKIQAVGARVVLATPSVIGERPNGENSLDKVLDEYADASRKIAKEEGAVLCDLRSVFVDYLRIFNPRGIDKGILTTDGVHLNEMGNVLVAIESAHALRAAIATR